MEKVVLITGGSRGIGEAAVKAFAAAGHRVAFVYNKSRDAAKKLEEATGAFAICADVSVSHETNRAVSLATEKFGGIDVLVNNAGISQIKLFTEITDDDWSRMIGVNLTGCFNFSRAVAPGMIARKSGSIINVSSMWGEVGASCEVHYSAAKAGVIGLTKALAKELGPSRVRVNCIAPGVIDTEMNGELDEAARSALKEQTPLMRIGAPEEVARAILFLASDDADFITGQVIGVNGGFVI